MTRSAQSAVSVAWQRGYTGSNGSTVVHRWIGTCNVTEELKAGGTDDVAVYNDIFIPGLHVLNVPENTLFKSKIYVYMYHSQGTILLCYKHFILQLA